MWYAIYAILSFIIAFTITPRLGKRLKKRKIVGVDLHKEAKPEVPEMGGLAILIAFLIPAFLAFIVYREIQILIGVIVVLLIGFLGILDGLKPLNPLQKVISFSIVGIILIPFSNSTVSGYNLGIMYFFLLPILFMFVCNFTNMLAGFNGLEIGTGAIATFAVLVLSILSQSNTSIIISASMFGALLAFLYYNKYPAKIFPGDVGTLIIGASLFTSIIFGKFEVLGLIIFLPYILDASLKFFSTGIMTRESQVPTIVRMGKLYIPEGSYLSLPRIFLRGKAMTENELVHRVWIIVAIFGLIAILIGVVA